jgi:hypothetical protein
MVSLDCSLVAEPTSKPDQCPYVIVMLERERGIICECQWKGVRREKWRMAGDWRMVNVVGE